MGKRDPRVDAYIEKSAEFAQPILRHLRQVIHAASPDIEETIKWSFPHFVYHGIVCSMAAFKQHCTFGFWKESLVLGNGQRREGAMGQFGRLRSISDLPSRKTLIGYVREAMKLNETGVKVTQSKSRKPRQELAMPVTFRSALKKHPRAAKNFELLSPSQRREYVEWVAEAKRDATRDRRIETAIAWISEGKSRNWKYMK